MFNNNASSSQQDFDDDRIPENTDGQRAGKDEEVLDLDDLLDKTEDGFQQHLKSDTHTS